MLTRYVKIRDAIKMVAAVEDLLPRPSTHRQIVQLVNKLEDLDSICVKLQLEDCTLGEVRRLFDTVMAKYPATSHHLGASARIVHLPVFEDAVVKLLSDREIIQEEEENVACFALPAPPSQRGSKKSNFEMLMFLRANRGLWDFTSLFRISNSGCQGEE
ncbi:hypothetical protein L917_10378 [Phytophthora nicotianae]|uniref:Uncharacterized protein n=1 Tax=Phytophthora nicotianae TaxID=4792 RepID=W2L2G1_PHYNI|nr:hypothetical protein L917_10378 [Phytophthora nicotianae]